MHLTIFFFEEEVLRFVTLAKEGKGEAYEEFDC